MLWGVMKKALKIIAILFVVVLVALSALGVWVYSWLTSDKFKQTLVDKTSEALGAKVTVEDLQFSVFNGFQLKGVKIANPSGTRAPEFFQADSFVLNYNWKALLNKKLEIHEISLVRPVVNLEQLPSGQWALPGSSVTVHPESTGEKSGGGTSAESPGKGDEIPLAIKKLQIEDGSLFVTDHGGMSPVNFKGLSTDSSVAVAQGKTELRGTLKISEISIVKLGTLTGINSNFELNQGVFAFQDFSAECFSGKLMGSGKIDLNQTQDLPVSLDLKGIGLDVRTLLSTLGNQSDQVDGRLNLNAKLSVPATRPLEITAQGNMDITECKVAGVPMLQLIGSVFNISEFQEMTLTKAYSDFRISGQVVTLANLILTTTDIRITGGGTITLDNQYDLKLVLNMSKNLYDKMPNDIKERLLPNEDGSFVTPEFRVYGAQNALKTDLLDKLLQKGIEDAAKKQLQKLNDKAGDLIKGIFR